MGEGYRGSDSCTRGTTAMTSATDKKVSDWERHIRTFGSAVALLLMGWMGTTMVTMGQDVAAIKVQLPAVLKMAERVNVLSERMALVEFQLYSSKKGDK